MRHNKKITPQRSAIEPASKLFPTFLSSCLYCQYLYDKEL